MAMIVTIGLCVKDCEANIQGVMASIVDQDFPKERMEIVVVDDGCKDRTIPIITAKLKQAGLPWKAFHTGGKGLGIARQIVIDRAQGKYIVWVDGDMTISKDFVRRQVSFMEENPKVAKARGKWKWLKKGKLAARLENMRAADHKLKQNPVEFSVSKLVGIGGSICRVEALKQVGGFDPSIKGAGEDIDLAVKLLRAGWKVISGRGEFYHKINETWKELWDQYVWYGYGIHYINHKYKRSFPVWMHTPPVALLTGLGHSVIAYRATHQVASFLLPFQYIFKNGAWILGFAKAHLDSYQPRALSASE